MRTTGFGALFASSWHHSLSRLVIDALLRARRPYSPMNWMPAMTSGSNFAPLSARHPRAATTPRRENHARLWSLIASCERHGVDPQRYLTSVLAKIGQTPAEQLGQFLPDMWKTEDAAESAATHD